MVFDNVRLDYQNVAFGPDSGRIYSIDHEADTLVVKTNPGGTLVTTIPLDTALQNEVVTLEYDGFYFWSQSNIGLTGELGTVINKWKLNSSSTLLEKQLGAGNEIVLPNTASVVYDTEAMCVHRIETTLSASAPSGSTSVSVASVDILEIGDAIYLGPSSAASGEREEREVTGISGTTILLDSPTTVAYNIGDTVTYRKDIWIFNNRNGTDTTGGSLIRVSSYTGIPFSTYSSAEWKHVTAASVNSGNLAFVRGTQYLEYKPLGITTGYQTSMILENMEVDHNTLIKVYDIVIDSTSVHKLQKKLHQFNTTSKEFEDIDSTDDKFNLHREFFAARVKSIGAIRTASVLFGAGDTSTLTVQVLDQFNVPVFGNSVSVQENDTSGLIDPGFESFTTDVNGQGVTRYNTGVSPDFNQPIITAIDVSSDLRLNLPLDQVPFIDNVSFIEQRDKVIGIGFVEQYDLVSDGYIEQRPDFSSFMYVQQLEFPSIDIGIVQDLIFSNLQVSQRGQTEGITQVEQFEKISDVTDVNQYDFLIFAIPVPYSVKNSPATDILVRVVGFGALSLDSSTLVFKVNGVDITNQVVVTPFAGGLELYYNPSEDFPYSSTVSVDISIEDTDVPPNTIDTYYTFDIVSDYKSPFLHEVYPPDGSVGNEPATEIYGIIKDLETGVDLTSIQMYVEGMQVTPVITDEGDGCVKVSYVTSCPYPYESNISVSILASDLEGNKFVGSWCFTVRSSSGVLFINSTPENCSVLVPVGSKVSTEVFGLEDGIRINSLDFSINGEEVKYVLIPKVYRKE
jgi:hypothetical protein